MKKLPAKSTFIPSCCSLLIQICFPDSADRQKSLLSSSKYIAAYELFANWVLWWSVVGDGLPESQCCSQKKRLQALNWRMLSDYSRWLVQRINLSQIHEGHWFLIVLWVTFCAVLGPNEPTGWALWGAALYEEVAKDNNCAWEVAWSGGYGRS